MNSVLATQAYELYILNEMVIYLKDLLPEEYTISAPQMDDIISNPQTRFVIKHTSGNDFVMGYAQNDEGCSIYLNWQFGNMSFQTSIDSKTLSLALDFFRKSAESVAQAQYLVEFATLFQHAYRHVTNEMTMKSLEYMYCYTDYLEYVDKIINTGLLRYPDLKPYLSSNDTDIYVKQSAAGYLILVETKVQTQTVTTLVVGDRLSILNSSHVVDESDNYYIVDYGDITLDDISNILKKFDNLRIKNASNR